MNLWKLLLISCFSFSVNATELTPAERMLHTMGVSQVLEQSKKAQQQSSKEQVSTIMRQLNGVISILPPEKAKEIEVLFQDMMDEILNSWTTQKAINIYSQAWNDNFTKEEILEVIEKYEAPESQREIQMMLLASSKLNEYILNSYNQASERAFAKTMPKMQSIIKGALSKKVTNTSD